jgi:hypothetical protein
MELSPSWEANSNSASQKNSPPFMEHKGSLMCSQETTTSPYSEPDASSLDKQ